MRTHHFRDTLWEYARECDGTVFSFHRLRPRIQNKLQTLRLQGLLQLSSDFRVFPRHNLLSLMNDRNAAPVSAEHLTKFQADIATAENHQMLGNLRELQDRFVGQKRRFTQSWNRRNAWPPARVDENLCALEDFFANP